MDIFPIATEREQKNTDPIDKYMVFLNNIFYQYFQLA